jgi:hypothetical protein
MAVRAKADAEPFPKVFKAESLPDHWVAEGTDGCLYKVPTEPGGWMRRDVFDGQVDELRPVSPQLARSGVWLIYGDVGTVTIAIGS